MSKSKSRKVSLPWKIGIVTARFNSEVTDKLRLGAIEEFSKHNLSESNLIDVGVPGAYEIPLAAAWLLDSGCDAVVALGAVIRGETSHYDYVCSAVERGCTELQLATRKPVVFGVLTTENDEQAMDRAGGRHGNKGSEAAQVAIEMLALKRNIKSQPKSKEIQWKRRT